MDSLAFSSATFASSLKYQITNPKRKTSYSSSLSSWPSIMVGCVPDFKSSSIGIGCSNSVCPHNINGCFSLSSSTVPGFLTNSRVYAGGAATETSIYDYTVKDIDGEDISLSEFKGKVLLIVNVASKCGLTSSNYSELSQLYDKYKSQGLEILAFPCNQFRGQEPGSNDEIKQFVCTRFKAEFPIFDKVDVNGPNAAPVYQFLKSTAGGSDKIKWNFEKFLVDKNGGVASRYRPTTSPLQIEEDIQKLLAV